MWPNKRERRRWQALEWATYVAQLMAPLALVVSSAFAFLGWQESRRATEIQRRIFAAQSGPVMEVRRTEAFVLSPTYPVVLVHLLIRNAGQSDAINACVRVLNLGSQPCVRVRHYNEAVRPGSDVLTAVHLPEGLIREMQFVPEVASLINVSESRRQQCRLDDSGTLYIRIEYEDAFGTLRDQFQAIELCPGPRGRVPYVPRTERRTPERRPR